MPPFLPIMGLNRSQNVRIGGQTVQQGKVTYVDLGHLGVPGYGPGSISATVGKAGKVSPGLTKSKKYKYLITALDAYGGETPPSAQFEKETEAGAEAENEFNEIKIEWTAIPGATSYNVYRTKAGGATGTEVLYANTTEAKYTDTGNGKEEAGKVPPATNNTFYSSQKGAVSPYRELQQHSAIGAYEVVGRLTLSNLDWGPLENTGWALTIESEKVKVAKSKELMQRSTGSFQATEVAEASISSIVSEASKEKYVYVVYNALLNVVEGVVGADEETASLSKINEKLKAFQQVLYLLKTKGTTKLVENVSSTLPNPPYVARV